MRGQENIKKKKVRYGTSENKSEEDDRKGAGGKWEDQTEIMGKTWTEVKEFSSFQDNIMADVASKQQTTALFLSSIVTRTRRHTELTNLMGNLCCAREHSVQFFMQFFLHG